MSICKKTDRLPCLFLVFRYIFIYIHRSMYMYLDVHIKMHIYIYTYMYISISKQVSVLHVLQYISFRERMEKDPAGPYLRVM